MQEFICEHCHLNVRMTETMGVKNRNHCPFCLWSKDVDQNAGDRRSSCHGLMEPIGLTLKSVGKDKYGREQVGELMLIHMCTKCGKFSINRIAGDDNVDQIMKVYKNSLLLDQQLKKELEADNIMMLKDEHSGEVKKQIFGK